MAKKSLRMPRTIALAKIFEETAGTGKIGRESLRSRIEGHIGSEAFNAEVKKGLKAYEHRKGKGLLGTTRLF